MKRSAAPSVALEHSIKSTKIGKFATPFKDATITATGSCRAGDKENVQIGDSVKLFYDSKRQDVQTAISDCQDVKRYFNVVWCKASRKKHKTWDNDGILIVNGRFATLKDLEGKDIGRTSGLKSSELESLCEGSALSIGGKDVEILNELSEDSYKSGRCFSQTIEETNLPAGKTMLTYNAPFSLPHSALPRSSCLSKLAKPKTIRPRHNPEADGAVVLPRPNSNLQWKQNKQGCPIVDVVVDPVISSHLRPHQKDGVIFLYKCIMGMGEFNGNGAILADEMGLGKTLQCISLIWTLLKQGPYSSKPVIKRVLVVTPGSLVKNWYTEFKKWLGSERVRVLAVSSAKHIEEFGKSLIHPVMVVSYEMLLRYISKVKCFGFDLLVCDEAHRLKNFSIKTSAAITSLCIERIILLTGTPIQNDLKEFFTLAQLCNPGIFGTSSSFRQVFENPINKSQQPNCSVDDDELGKQRAAELKRLAASFVLRRTAEINSSYLPAKVELVVFCNTSSLQKRLYQAAIRSRMVRSCLSSYYRGSQHLICISALKKLCNHPVLLLNATRKNTNPASRYKSGEDEDDILLEDEDCLYDDLYTVFPNAYESCYEAADSGKLKVLDRLLCAFKDQHEKVVIVSNSTKTLDVIESLLKTKAQKYLRLDGQTSMSDRMKLVDRFNSNFSDIDVFMLSSKAGGTGLNLIGASRLVLYDIDWNPANDLQAMARIWRDGQKKKVHIYRLLTTGTIEEKIFQRQVKKQSLSGSVVDSGSSKANFSHEDIKDLFTFHESTTCSTHELLSCNCRYLEYEVPVESTTAETTRSSQLGINPKKTEKKQSSMAELMSWTHIEPPGTEKLKDQVLASCLQDVSFIFQYESKECN